jgi:hypothetical protein
MMRKHEIESSHQGTLFHSINIFIGASSKQCWSKAKREKLSFTPAYKKRETKNTYKIYGPSDEIFRGAIHQARARVPRKNQLPVQQVGAF